METLITPEEPENRIMIGGKRKSSGRRSSILKGSKSPLKVGALEELDPNSLDNESRSKSKRARQSTGRRVSFAEKNEIKEFFVEDWQSAWKKEVEQNNLQMANNPSQSGYREPANSIKGIDTLLRGSIQDDEVIPDQMIKQDGGLSLAASDDVQSLGLVHNSLCHGATVSEVNTYHNTAKLSSSHGHMREEMEQTRCFNSHQLFEDPAADVDPGDQTRIFGSNDASQLDITCFEEEVFFQDHPNEPGSSPDNCTERAKMDSSAFLMYLKNSDTSFVGNQPPTRNPVKVIDEIDRPCSESLQSKALISEDSEAVSFKVNTGNLCDVRSSSSRKPLGEIKDMRSSAKETQSVCLNGGESQQQEQQFEVDLDLTTCLSNGPVDLAMQKTKRRSIYETSCMDVTACFRSGIINSSDQQGLSQMALPTSSLSGVEPTWVLKQNAQDQTVGLNMTCCYGNGILAEKAPMFTDADQTVVFDAEEENGDSLDFTVCQGQGVLARFPSSTSQMDLAQSSKSDSRNMDSSAFLRALCGANETNTTDDKDVSDPLNEEMDLTAVHGPAMFKTTPVQTEEPARQMCGPVNQLDVTSCSGNGILANYQVAPNQTKEERSVGLGDSDALDFTICRGRPFSNSNLQTQDAFALTEGSRKLNDSSIFLQSPYRNGSPGTGDAEKVSAEMDLTATYDSSFGVENNALRTREIDNTNNNYCTLGLKDIISPAKEGTGKTHSRERNYWRGETKGSASQVKTVSGGNELLKDDSNLELSSHQGNFYKDVDYGLQKSKQKSVHNVTSLFCPGLTALPNKHSLGSSIHGTLDHAIRGQVASQNGPLSSANDLVRQGIHPDKTSVTELGDQDRQGRRCILNPIPLSLPASTREKFQIHDSKNIFQPVTTTSSSFKEGEVLPQVGRNSSFKTNEVMDRDSASDIGWNPKHQEDTIVKFTICRSFSIPDISVQMAKRKSVGELCERDMTSTFDRGPVMLPSEPAGSNSAKQSSVHTRYQEDLPCEFNESIAVIKAKPMHSKEMPEQLIASRLKQPCDDHKSNDHTAEKGERLENAGDMLSSYVPLQMETPLKQATNDSLQSNLSDTRCQESTVHKFNEVEASNTTGSEVSHPLSARKPSSSSSKEAGSDGNSKLMLTRCREAAFHGENETAALKEMRLSQLQEIPEESQASQLEIAIPCGNLSKLNDSSTQRECEESSVQKQCNEDCNTSFDSEHLLEEPAETGLDPHKMSTIEEVENGNKREVECTSKNIAEEERPITVKEFLEITEIAFITGVNTRRSTAPLPFPINSAQTLKDNLVSSLISAPKTACYEELFPTIESQIEEMKEKVEQQEEELNLSNPRLFMDAQSASKEELVAMRTGARRLRSACEKMAAWEWKERKMRLNKTILAKMKENHQGLARDVNIIEESLEMVEDCFKLVDERDEDFDQKLQDIEFCLQKSEKILTEQEKMADELQALSATLKETDEGRLDLESKRSRIQNEKDELDKKKEELEKMVIEKEEELRSIKLYNQQEQRPSCGAKVKFNLLQSLQEWELEEWDENHAKFAFFMKTVELEISFGPVPAGTKASWEQTVDSIKLNYTSLENISSCQRKVHTLMKKCISRERLAEICSTKADLPKVLEDISFKMFKAKCVGDEIYRICLGHLITLNEDRFVVEFVSIKAFLKFVLDIQLDVTLYPSSVSFAVSLKIGHCSQAEIEEALNAVKHGPFYLSRLVETADKLLEEKAASAK